MYNLPIQTTAAALDKLATLFIEHNLVLSAEDTNYLLTTMTPQVILVMTEPDLLAEVNELLLK